MKIEKGKLVVDIDNTVVEFSGKCAHLSARTMGGKEYHNGETVEGIVVNLEFCLCREFVTPNHGKVYGYISEDEITSDNIEITTINSNTLGTILSVNRDEVENYE